MASRQYTININTVAGSGGTGTADISILTNNAIITKVKCTISVAGGTYDLEFFQKDAKAAGDLAYKVSQAVNTFFDPVEDVSGVETERNTGFVAMYEDLDATKELHVKVTNDDSSTKNFTIVVDVEDFDPHADEFDNGNSGAADTIDWNEGTKQKSTLTASTTYTFTDPPGPANLTLRIVQDATGTWTVTWPASVKWAGGSAPTISAGANDIDIITFYHDGTDYFGSFIQNMS